jgi:hypothetical protein
MPEESGLNIGDSFFGQGHFGDFQQFGRKSGKKVRSRPSSQ